MAYQSKQCGSTITHAPHIHWDGPKVYRCKGYGDLEEK